MNCGHCVMCIFCIILKMTVCTYEAVYYNTVHFNINHLLHYTPWHTVRIFIILFFIDLCNLITFDLCINCKKRNLTCFVDICVYIPKSMFHYSSACSCSVK